MGPGAIFLPFVLLFLVFISYQTYQQQRDSIYITALLAIICVSLHGYRKDKHFVFTQLENPRFEMFIEYFFLTLPFSITSLFTSNWHFFFFLQLVIICIVQLRFGISTKTRLKKLSVIIPSTAFEWISGVRKSYYFLIPVYLMALSFSWMKILPLVALWILAVSISAFYNECESLMILREGGNDPKKFLNNKLFKHSRYFVLLWIPVLLVNTLVNPDQWSINIIFLIVQVAFLVFCICMKYASYKPDEDRIANSVVISLVGLGSVIPYLLPIPVMMAAVYYRKALNNLEDYIE